MGLFNCSDLEFKEKLSGFNQNILDENKKKELKEGHRMELKYGKNDVIIHGILAEKSEPKVTKVGGLVLDVKILIPGTKETTIPLTLFGDSADIANSILINSIVICHGRLAGEVYTDKSGVERSALKLWSSMICEVKLATNADSEISF